MTREGPGLDKMKNGHDRDWCAVLAGLTDRIFPERQFYYRSRGHVRFVSLGKSGQGILAAILIVSFGWTISASVHLLFQDRVIESKNRRIASVESANERLARELSDTRDRFGSVTRDLEAQHRQLLDLVHHKGWLEARLSALAGELDATVGERDKALATGRTLTARVDRLEADLDAASSRNASLSDSLGKTRQSLSQVTRDRDGARQRHASAAKRAVRLKQRLTGLKSSQRALVERIRDRTHAGVEKMEAMVESTGLDVGDLLRLTEAGKSGQGGPLTGPGPAGYANESDGMGTGFENSVLELESQLARWEGLQRILETLPLTPPVDHYYISSRFGKRRDPFTKRWAMHQGLDFAGPLKTPVHATAAGLVTYAGRKGPYGRFVEIDHGLDIKTRYAHLHKILVKKGQRVEFREKVGTMGSTGRSTDSHTHYEVLFNGRPQDPENFLKAGKHVFKD